MCINMNQKRGGGHGWTKSTQTISFCIFDDLVPFYGPIHAGIEGELTSENIRSVIRSMFQTFMKENDGHDPTKFFNNPYDDNEDIEDTFNYITEGLLENQYYVRNRWEKYYVIAYAINFVRFEIFSKECDKCLIKWRENDQDDPIVSIISDPDYNQNPVCRLLGGT